jgi:hypothetical protein
MSEDFFESYINYIFYCKTGNSSPCFQVLLFKLMGKYN